MHRHLLRRSAIAGLVLATTASLYSTGCSDAGNNDVLGTGSGGSSGTSNGGGGEAVEPAGSAGTGGQPAQAGGASGGTSGGSAGGAGTTETVTDAGGGTDGPTPADGGHGLPDPGIDGDGDSKVGPNFPKQADLQDHGNPKGKRFNFSMPLANSAIFNGKDATLTMPASSTRSINVYVPSVYKDGDPAPVLIIQDGPGELNDVALALDNLTISQDPARKLPAFIVVAVQNGGSDSIGSERGLEYDTLSDRYARFIELEVLPAVQANADVKASYPKLKFTKDPSGRATLGCSSGAAAAFTMAWFRPDLFSRVIAYSATLVAQQDPKAPESQMYPLGAWDYHSELELIKNDKTHLEKQVRIFINANDMDNGYNAAESGHHNWLMANQRTAAALKAKGFHYKYIEGMGAGHCAGGVQSATLADVLVWVWRGYQPSGI